ncbi:tetratricopeptide repeat protein [Ruegeria sp. MALMAid1280]|uniref:tetratricopeptide repeat protein n=1 Tax=Ruegeria sp. MALMAid1280 TaxID=3411634 RepID=UPI003BA08872
MSRDPFEKANRLWFDEGCTARALAAYEVALRVAPDDPVVALQTARALWSMDRFDEAAALLEKAHTLRAGLNARGQRELDRWRDTLRSGPPDRRFPELPPEVLDRDRLNAAGTVDWRTVADAARAREMFGLAAYAAEQVEGVPIDAEDARDILDHGTRAMLERDYLQNLRPGAQPPLVPSEDQPAVSEMERPTIPSSVATPEAASPTPKLPPLPLVLRVQAYPAEGPVAVPTTLTANLINAASETVIVNSRMLLNNPGGAGEVWLNVRGPDGYRNQTGFRVRAGRTPREFFMALAPGAAISQSWKLGNYQSLHLPGTYRVELTYHNALSHTPDGRPMTVGTSTGTTHIWRG